MARRLSAIEEWEVYVPNVGDERATFRDDPSNALTCEVRFLSKDNLERYNRIAQRAARMGSSKGDEEQVRQLLTDNVRNVRNYTLGDREITDGAGIYEAATLGDNDILLDVVAALVKRSHLEAGLAKKLSLPSDSSSSPQTRSGPGVAPGVTGA